MAPFFLFMSSGNKQISGARSHPSPPGLPATPLCWWEVIVKPLCGLDWHLPCAQGQQKYLAVSTDIPTKTVWEA